MAQPETAAGEVSTPADTSPADAFENIAAEMLGESEDEPEEAVEGEQPDGEASEDDPELEAEDEELPPIEAPVSWDAEAKEKFAALPRDVQEYVHKREGERERFVQSKAQEATRAKQEVEQAALSQLAAYETQVSQTLQQYAEQLTPQRPNPALLQHDAQAFYALQADYEGKVAQQRELQQQSQHYAHQAQAREAQAQQAYHAEQKQILSQTLPEFLDPTTGPKLAAEFHAVAKEMGYPEELISQARATDILAMKTAAEWKAKAAKYDAAMSKQMSKVRAAKGLPKPVKPGAAVSSDQSRTARANAAWEATKSSKGQARDDAFATYLQSTGQL